MTSGLSSQSRPWFTLTTYDENLADDASVKVWLGEVETRLYSFLAHTNFYGAAKTGYLEMGAFGTEACVMLEHDDEGAVCHALTFGEYWIGLNDALLPGALYRECVNTTIQAVEQFGYANVSGRIRRLRRERATTSSTCFYHAIEENDDYVAGKLGPTGKAVALALLGRERRRPDASSSSPATKSSRSGRRAGTRPATMHGDRGRATTLSPI
jgi:hypothetical protein